MPYDAAQLVADLPAEMRVELTTAGGEAATVGRASISDSVAATLYGDEQRYEASFWFDANSFATPPTRRERVTVEGVSYYVLAVRQFPGSLRRLDVGGHYGG